MGHGSLRIDGAELTVEDIIGITSAKLTLSRKECGNCIADNRAALENLLRNSGKDIMGSTPVSDPSTQ
ncbi:MAG: hypothetical protein IPP25_16295 [Saprospiraceae bacterium]|nr:hypothetical protein [Candidatus Opimibacter skivensis]